MEESMGGSTLGSSGSPGIEASDIGLALRQLNLSFRLYERHLAHAMHLKPTEYQAMEHILDGGGALGPLELASRLDLAAGTTSELLDRLQHLGHVVRDRDDNDRRRVRLAPTPSATAEIFSAITPAVSEIAQLASRLDPAEQVVICRFLAEVSAALTSHALRPLD
ncbi:MAG: MarR family transcriptional regulator [Propionicimonas sp.]